MATRQTSNRRLVGAPLCVAVAVALWGGAVVAQSLPRLPDEVTIAKSADSPGQVLFNHSTHVDADKPACTSCHPKAFRILKANADKRPITHDAMEKGGQCGSCHNGTKSFGLQDDCTICHRGE